MPILDTNLLIALHAEDAQAVALLQDMRGQRMIVPDVVAAEYLTNWPDQEIRERLLAALQSDFTLASTGPEWALAAASLRAQLRKQGRLVRTPDVWIAAWSRLLGEAVITRDVQDFRDLCDVVTW